MAMKKRILLVDDDINLRLGLRRTLEPMHDQWEPILAANGRDALHLLAHTPCDVVVTDILMPEQDGIEVIWELRRRFPTIKIIAMSGGGQIGRQSVLRLATAFGAHGTLTKPFRTMDLLAAIRGVLLDQDTHAKRAGTDTRSRVSASGEHGKNLDQGELL
jgi:DNA-binding NtrC family response regulator